MSRPIDPTSVWSRPFAIILGAADLGAGLLYLLGPDRWHSGGNFAFIKALPVPILAWAVVFAAAGAALLADRRHRLGPYPYAVGAAALGLWGLLQAMTLPTTATGGAGPVWVCALAALHYLGLWARAQGRAARQGDPGGGRRDADLGDQRGRGVDPRRRRRPLRGGAPGVTEGTR